MRTSVADSLALLHDAGLDPETGVVGCSQAFIDELELELRIKLPESYKQFLLLCGERAGWFLTGSEYQPRHIRRLQIHGRDIALRSGVALPDSVFVFLMDQGCSFVFFQLGSGGDPPVLAYYEGDEAPKQIHSSFTEWLRHDAEQAIRLSNDDWTE